MVLSGFMPPLCVLDRDTSTLLLGQRSVILWTDYSAVFREGEGMRIDFVRLWEMDPCSFLLFYRLSEKERDMLVWAQRKKDPGISPLHGQMNRSGSKAEYRTVPISSGFLNPLQIL